jgi:ribosomal protein S18 acetylase RimI-like enzyme
VPFVLFKKLRRNLRDYGCAVCCKKAVSQIYRPFFESQSYCIYSIDLRKSLRSKNHALSEFTFRFVSANESKIIAQIEDMEEWLHGKLTDKFRSGQQCLVALQGETVAGFNLVGFETFHIPLLRLSKPLHPHECYSEQITVHPDFRGRGLGTELRYRIFSAMKEAGFHRLYGGTQLSSTANRALSKKVGLRVFAIARFINICGCTRLTFYRKNEQ